MTTILHLPIDVLWLILKEVIIEEYKNFKGIGKTSRDERLELHEMSYHEGYIGQHPKSPLASTLLYPLMEIHPNFAKAIRKKIIWHKTWGITGWDFKPGVFIVN